MATVDGIELRQLVCNNAFEPRWESYTLDDLGPDEVRVRSELTAAKHGTEKGEITGESIYCSVPMDPDGRVFDRSRTHPYDPATWKPVGNTTVGTVMAAGSEVEDVKEGDRVYGYGGFRPVHQGRHFKPLLPGFTEEAACCMDPADFALAAVRDGQVRIGERVIVFGMGAIGLFTVQLGPVVRRGRRGGGGPDRPPARTGPAARRDHGRRSEGGRRFRHGVPRMA